MKENKSTCPACGAALPGSAPLGLCPKCLADLGESEPTVSELRGQKSEVSDQKAQAGTPPDSGVRPLTSDFRPLAFGDYELLEEIARGGMGVVYRARHRSLNRVVAVKMILSAQFAGKQFGQRFRNEAAAAAILQHPNIVAIHDVGVLDGQQFFSMDYVVGQNLAQLVGNRPLPPARAARYLKLIAEAIHYAHDQGILHRDLKPSNVLIDSATDQPRITDFGLAKRLDGTSSLTVTGQVLGSPNFMPPEQAGSDRGKVGRPSDVYALGGILYFLLAARAPFLGESLEVIVTQVLNSEPVSPRLLNPAVPRDLETICLKCLEKEPAKRFQTAQELADELSRFLRDEPILARPVSAPEKLWRWCRRKPALAILGGGSCLLLLALLIGGPILFWRIAVARERAEQNLYVANVRLANEALAANNLVHARALLDGIADSTQQRQFRGWEWQHLMERCRAENSVVLGTHDAYVAAAALSPDGRTAASLSGDGIVKVWNLAARKLELPPWTAHENPEKGKPTFSNLALVFSPDGATIATGGRDNTVRIWETISGRKIAELRELTSSCRGLGFSDDGRLLGAIDIVGQACLWALTHGKPALLHRWPAGGVLARDVAFSPDSMHLIVSGYEQPATVWVDHAGFVQRRQWRESTGRTCVGQRRGFLRHDRRWRQQRSRDGLQDDGQRGVDHAGQV
ncbi:MAG: serine/threonine-protein kinase [Verrucomicrobiales bacterium]|nr:serine/threonine-protein kinase [Verrucomicrobiales bacterium]